MHLKGTRELQVLPNIFHPISVTERTSGKVQPSLLGKLQDHTPARKCLHSKLCVQPHSTSVLVSLALFKGCYFTTPWHFLYAELEDLMRALLHKALSGVGESWHLLLPL